MTLVQPRVRRRRTALISAITAVLLLAGAAIGGGVSSSAEAAQGDVVIPPGELAITFVARTCEQYTDIMANRARNNIQESLRDLGKDTVYEAGVPITPEIEEPNDPNCTPLRNWQFQMGTGYMGKTEATNYLSTVTGAYATPITTGGPIAELDSQGADTGRTIDGAVTVVLTPEQAQRAQQGNSLWVQGGRVEQTLPASGEWGFGALRCAVDNLNGDNVEFVTYPTAARHVYCYYYAVSPPPAAGTIIVRKQLTADTPGGSTFPFEGNISYDRPSENDTGQFTLNATANAPGQITFIRGAVGPNDPRWNFQELIPDGWQLTSEPTCDTSLGSAWDYNPASGISVTLVADDVVTCTFINERQLTGPAFLFKQTTGGIGSFPFEITPPEPEQPVSTTVDVTETDTPTQVASTAGNLPGTYTATETLPVVDYGTWDLESVICDDGEDVVDVPFTASGQQRTASHAIAIGGTTACLFTNVFASDGEIQIEKTSLDGVGTFPYVIAPVTRDEVVQHSLSATTQTPGTPVLAQPSEGSPPPTGLPIGSVWDVQEFLPAPTLDGYWRVQSAECGPGLRGANALAATVRVEITEQNPVVLCRFVNEFVSVSTLDIIKTTSADTTLRPDPAVLEWGCDDGTGGELDVPVGDARAELGAVQLAGYLDCIVTESTPGGAPGVGVTTSATVTVNGSTSSYELGSVISIEPEDSVLVVVDNVLTAPTPTPTPTPTITPTVAPTPGPTTLPATGGDFSAMPPTLWAIGAVLIGSAVVITGTIARRRRR